MRLKRLKKNPNLGGRGKFLTKELRRLVKEKPQQALRAAWCQLAQELRNTKHYLFLGWVEDNVSFGIGSSKTGLHFEWRRPWDSDHEQFAFGSKALRALGNQFASGSAEQRESVEIILRMADWLGDLNAFFGVKTCQCHDWLGLTMVSTADTEIEWGLLGFTKKDENLPAIKENYAHGVNEVGENVICESPGRYHVVLFGEIIDVLRKHPDEWEKEDFSLIKESAYLQALIAARGEVEGVESH